MPERRPARPWPVAWGAVALLYAWFFWRAYTRLDKGVGDFRYFFNAAGAMRAGADIYASTPDRGYIYPPLIAFLYTPLTFLSDRSAAILLLLFNTALSALGLVIVSRELMRRLISSRARSAVAWVALLGLALIADKVRIELRMWQTNVLMLTMFILALTWLDKRPRLAGLALGFAFNVKYLTIVFLPYLLIRRRWRTAAWFGVGIIFFALLPALYTGWGENARNLRIAGSGLLRLFGVPIGDEAANIQSITVHWNLSITGALARAFEGHGPGLALAVAAVIGAACAGLAAWSYGVRRVPVFDWPAARHQTEQPYLALVGVEWTALIAGALAFSPQTNSRHLSLLLPACVACSAILLYARPGFSRSLLAVGVLVMLLGVNLPPGSRRFKDDVERWESVGGPAWCVLVMTMALVHAGAAHARSLIRDPRPDLASSAAAP